jgi:hypothetical protein
VLSATVVDNCFPLFVALALHVERDDLHLLHRCHVNHPTGALVSVRSSERVAGVTLSGKWRSFWRAFCRCGSVKHRKVGS